MVYDDKKTFEDVCWDGATHSSIAMCEYIREYIKNNDFTDVEVTLLIREIEYDNNGVKVYKRKSFLEVLNENGFI